MINDEAQAAAVCTLENGAFPDDVTGSITIKADKRALFKIAQELPLPLFMRRVPLSLHG